MQITKVKMPTDKYSIKCPYSMNPTRIVVHNTYNNASAMSEISYMIGNNNKVSFHYAVDGTRAVQGIEENRNSWNAGDGTKGKGNREGIAIEICYSKSGGDNFIAAEKNGAKLVAYILNKYGWGIDKVTKHQDYSGKYCPHRTLDMGWQRFINMVKEELKDESKEETKPSSTTTSTTLKYSKGNKIVLNGYLYRDSYGNNKGSKKSNYKGTITKVNSKGTKPYHIDSLGWVAEADIKLQSTTSTTSTTKTKTTTGNIYLRKTASYGDNVICVIPKGKKVTYYSGTGWAKVKYNNKTGYCGYKYLK